MPEYQLKKEVRVLLYANPGEFDAERTVIHDVVVPQLRHFCHDEFNVDFVIIDPYQSAPGLKTTAPSIDKIEELLVESFKISDGPAALVLIGDKFGEKGAPNVLTGEQFDILVSQLKSKNNPWWITLQKKYLPVSDKYPMEYCLDRASLSFEEGVGLHKAICETAADAVSCGSMTQEELDKFSKSDLEKIMQRVMLDKNTVERSVCILRQMKDRETWTDTSDNLRPLFLDTEENSSSPQECYDKLEDLRTMLGRKFPRENYAKLSPAVVSLNEYREYHEFKVAAKSRSGKAPLVVQRIAEINLTLDSQSDYFSAFAKQVYEKVKLHVIKILKKKDFVSDKLHREVECHKMLLEGVKYPDRLYTRDRELKILDNYLSSSTARTPGMLYGESGAGKTTLLRYALKKISQLHAQPIIVLRTCGRTCNSSTLQGILATMTEEISRAFKALFTKPYEYATCVYDFWRILQMANSKRPIFVLLDDAEQLFPQSHTEMYRWLPHRLPPFVKVLLTTSHESLYGGFKRRYDETSAVTVPGISTNVLLKSFPARMQLKGKLMDERSENLANHLFQQNSLPLFADVLAAVLPVKDDKLPDRIKLVFMKYIEQLEVQHTIWLTKYTLSYMACARFGLSLQEIMDLLSLDNCVVQDCGLNLKVSTSFRIPVTLVLNLLDNIQGFLLTMRSDERYLFSFKHEVVRSAILDHYQLNKEFGVVIHSQMADYFSGRWGGSKMKPLFDKMMETDESKTVNLDRQVQKLPFYWVASNIHGAVTCDGRKLSELPVHYMKSEKVNDLFRQTLFCFDYLYAKLALSSVNDLVSEMYFLRQVYEVRVNNELEVLIALLRLLAPVLEKDADFLGPEICGRLCHLVGQQPLITALVQQTDAYGPKVNCLLPTIPCYSTLDADELRVQLPQVKGTIISCMSPDNRFLATLLPMETDLMLFVWDSKSATKSQIINLGAYKNTSFTKIIYMPQSDEHVILQFKTDKNVGYWFVNLNTATVENKLPLPLDSRPEVIYLSKSLITVKINGQIKIYNYSTAEQALEYKDLHWPFYFTPSDKYIVALKQRAKGDLTTKLETNLRLINMQSGDNACILDCSMQVTYMYSNNRSEFLYVGCKTYGVIYKFDISQVVKRDIRRMKPSFELSLENQENIPDEVKSLYKKYKAMTSVVGLTTSAEDKHLLAEYNISDIKNIYVVWSLASRTVQAVFLKMANDRVRFATDGAYVYQFVPYSSCFTNLVVFNTSTGELTQETNIGQQILDCHIIKDTVKGSMVLMVLERELVLSTLKKLEEQNSETELQVHQYATSFVDARYNPELNIVYNNNPNQADFSYFNLDSNRLYAVDMSHNNISLTRYPVERHISPDGTKLVLSYGSQSNLDRMNRQRGSISNYVMTPQKGQSTLIQTKTDFRKPEIPGVNYFIGGTLQEKKSVPECTGLRHEVVYEQRILRVIDTTNSEIICQISLSGESILKVTNQFILTFKPDYASIRRDNLFASDIISLYDLTSGCYQSSIYLENSVLNASLMDNNTKMLVCCGKNGRYAKVLGGTNFEKVLNEVDLEAVMKVHDEYARAVIVKRMHIFLNNINSILIYYCWREGEKEYLYAKIDLIKKERGAHFSAADVIHDVSRDGRWAIDRGLRLYDLSKGDLMKQLNLTQNFDFENINCISKFTDDGQYIVVLDNNDKQLYVMQNELRTQMLGKARMHRVKLDNTTPTPYQLSIGQSGKVVVVHNSIEFKVFVLKDQSKVKRIQEVFYHNVTERARHLMPKKTFNNIDAILGKRLAKEASRVEDSDDNKRGKRAGSRRSPGGGRKQGGTSRTPTSPVKSPTATTVAA